MTNQRANNGQSPHDNNGSANAFEVGSRHPRWKGGVDKITSKNRAKTYRQHGIGTYTATNSGAAFARGPKLVESNFEDFTKGKVLSFVISLETNTKAEKKVFFELLKRIDPTLVNRSLAKMLKNTDLTMLIPQNVIKFSIRLYVTNDINKTTNRRLTTLNLENVDV